MATNPLKTNLYGAGLVGTNGTLSQPLVNFLLAVLAQATATADTAQAAQDAANSVAEAGSITIQQGAGIVVSFDGDSVYTISASGGTSSGSGSPLSIDEDAIYTVAANTQVLFHEEISVDGELRVDGVLVGV